MEMNNTMSGIAIEAERQRQLEEYDILKSAYIYSIRQFKAMESSNTYSIAAQLEIRNAMNAMTRSMSVAMYGPYDDDK